MKKNLYQKLSNASKKSYPGAKCALNFSNPLEILVAKILSAQCTDKRVNIVTKDLFKKYKSAKDYANADIKELERDIKSTGFYRNKAKSIKNGCKVIVEEFNGKIPNKMEDLIKLPGGSKQNTKKSITKGTNCSI